MKANDNEILTLEGKRVRVMYTDELEGLCDGCVFCDPTEDGCTLNNTITAKKCYGMSTHGNYAYFVAAENTAAAPGAPIAFEHRILGRADISSCCD